MRFVFAALLWIWVSSVATFGHENAHAAPDTHSQHALALKSAESVQAASLIALSCDAMTNTMTTHCLAGDTEKPCATPDCLAACLGNTTTMVSSQVIFHIMGKGQNLKLSRFLAHKGLSIPPPIPPPLASFKV